METALENIYANVDFKGLSVYSVQSAIDRYVGELTIRKYEQQRAEETRNRVANRARVRNAIKRTGLRVNTEKDSWRSRGVDLGRCPVEEGWWSVSYATGYTAPQGRRLEMVAEFVANLRNSADLDLRVKSRIVNGEVHTAYYVKLK